MVSFSLLRLAMSCGRIGLWVVGRPSCLVECCSNVGGTVQPIDYFILIDHQFEDGTLTRCFALSPGLGTNSS